jgi:hypothetical protein
MNTDDIIDVIVMIIILALFSSVTIANTIPLYRGQLGGFDVQIEKTALPTSGEIVPIKNGFTKHDAILMLVIADEYFPEPRVIEIIGKEDLNPLEPNDPTTITIDIDSLFFHNRTEDLIAADKAMRESNNMNYELYVGQSGLRKWVLHYE